MKKIYRFIIVQILLTTLWACTSISSSESPLETPVLQPMSSWHHEAVAQIPISLFPEANAQEITRELIVQWLEGEKQAKPDESDHLIAFAIHQIEISETQQALNFQKEHPENFYAIANVRFSVEPVRLIYSDWAAGNGDVKKGDTWIRNKSLFVAVVENDGMYVLYFIGTGL